jgi:hypothetical protein
MKFVYKTQASFIDISGEISESLYGVILLGLSGPACRQMRRFKFNFFAIEINSILLVSVQDVIPEESFLNLHQDFEGTPCLKLQRFLQNDTG